MLRVFFFLILVLFSVIRIRVKLVFHEVWTKLHAKTIFEMKIWFIHSTSFYGLVCVKI